MKQLVSLTPENLEYIRQIGQMMGYKKGFSAALNKIIDDHKKMKDLNKLRQEILELKYR